jgi:hypothetical protein
MREPVLWEGRDGDLLARLGRVLASDDGPRQSRVCPAFEANDGHQAVLLAHVYLIATPLTGKDERPGISFQRVLLADKGQFTLRIRNFEFGRKLPSSPLPDEVSL